MMFQIDRWSAKARWYVLVPLLVAVTAETAAAGISRQEPARRPSRVRSCAQCAGMDSLETQRAKLLDRFESLKWEFENKRLNELERDRVAKEMAVTMAALESNAEAAMRLQGVMIATEVQGQARRTEEALAQAMPVDRSFQPRGYIGVTFDGPYVPRDEEMTIRFFAYPRIALVEPSSPAERAGIVVGDTLVSLNGNDLRDQEIAFGRLLIPNKRLTMRVRRDGESRELRLTVAEAPESFLRRSRTPSVQVVPVPRSGQVSVYGRGGSRAAVAPVPQGSSAGGYVYWFGNDALGGARMQTITAGLAKAMNVKQGVLILTVAPGSPAWESGLREGDVVINAGGDDVRTINDVQLAITAGERDRAVRLVVVSEGRKRDLTFRW